MLSSGSLSPSSNPARTTAIDDKLAATAPSDAFPGVAAMIAGMRNAAACDRPEEVAAAIVAAAEADPAPLRVQVGDDARRLYQARREMDDRTLADNLMALLQSTG